ncbi:MAG: hypothetical protein QF722_06865, partial [Candidatus Thalassarchaeaceae archaeon]|nr:hypothetical protein [Candidatus Thalassarchaeaceae archaeon]
EINCIIIAPEFAMAGWQPEIGLTIDADGIERSAGAVITVASNPAVDWTTHSMDESIEDSSSLLHLEISNIGNTVVQERVIIDAPKGWKVEFVDSAVVNLAIQESQSIRLQVTPDSSGEGTIGLSFEESNIPGSTYSISMDVAADPTKKSEGGSGTTIAIIGLLIFIVVGLIAAGVLIVRLRDQGSAPKSNMAPPPAAAFLPQVKPQAKQKTVQEIVCWGCQNPIVGSRRACPSCGARYHEAGYACSASSLVKCRNCGANVETFVVEVSS